MKAISENQVKYINESKKTAVQMYIQQAFILITYFIFSKDALNLSKANICTISSNKCSLEYKRLFPKASNELKPSAI